jgi:PAS domain S-box-containing protein
MNRDNESLLVEDCLIETEDFKCGFEPASNGASIKNSFSPFTRNSDSRLSSNLKHSDSAIRKVSDNEIRESEKRFRILGDSILHQVWTAKPDGSLDYVNARALEYRGLSMEEALNEVWQESIYPDDLALCSEKWESSLLTGEPYEMEFRLRGADGKYRWHLGRAIAERDENGKIIKWYGTNTDINDQKLAEESLRKSEERFQLAARATNDVLWDWDIVTNEVWWNKGIQTAFGYASDSVDDIQDRIGWWLSKIHPEDKDLIEASISEFLAGTDQVWMGEYRFIRGDGSFADVIDRRTILRDEEDIPLRMVGSLLDVSEKRRAERALLESEQLLRHSQKMEAIGTLTGGVAHDFNNLLTAIIGNAQLALCKLETDDPLRTRLLEIEKASNRAAMLTRQLLAFSRRQHLERRTINLNDTISEISRLLQRIIGEDIEISVKSAPNLSQVFADPAQIEQVIMNLCVNARDAMPDGGKLVIETRNVELDESYCRQYTYAQPGKYIQIKITDNGVGMSEEIKTRIFDPFFTTKEVGKGTGLGLSIAYGIIKQHEGHINVYSKLGTGTTFKILLPVTEKSVEKQTTPSQFQLFGGNETILVAEDEESLQDLAKDVLSRLGYKVLVAGNGEEAIEIFEKNRDKIDLLLFDIVMPRMGGAEAYQRIKESGGRVPLILMTGYSTDTVNNKFFAQHGSTANFNEATIQKPYSLTELGNTVREVLDNRYKLAAHK